MRPTLPSLLIVTVLVATFPTGVSALAEETSADKTAVGEDVLYSRDIAPILRRNCVACHREKQAEGGLSLETTKAILVGGESGSLLVAANPDESLLLARAIDDDDPMPPEDNSVGAKRLTLEELDLVKRWILQGAELDDDSATMIQWQPIPETFRSSYSLATSPDNRLVAVGHANRVELADAQTGTLTATLVDDGLSPPGVADVDVIQAIAFSPTADRIATAGYKTVRVWKRESVPTTTPPALASAVGNVASSPDQNSLAIVNAIGDVEIWDVAAEQKKSVIPSQGKIADLDWRSAERLTIGYESGDLRVFSVTDAALIGQARLDHPIARVSQNPDGRFIASLGSDAQSQASVLRLFEELQPKPLQTLDAIKDATAICFVDSGTLAVGTNSGNVVLVDVANDKITSKLEHGAPVGAIAVNRSSTAIASGDHVGGVKLWNAKDATTLHTMVGDSQSRLKITTLDQDIKREESWLQSLGGKTDELKKLLEKEDAALAKVTETRQKAEQELGEKTKQRDDTAGKIKETEAKIAQAMAQIEQLTESVAGMEALIVKNDGEIKQIAEELKPLEEQAATAASNLQAAQAKADEAMRALDAAKKTATDIAAKLTEKKNQSAAIQKTSTETAAKLTKSKTEQAEATKQVEAENAALAKQREMLAANEKEVETKQADLAEREQALVTAKKTRDQAADNLPRHQETIRSRNNQLVDLKHQLAAIQAAQSKWPAVATIAFTPDDAELAAVDVQGNVRTFATASGQPLDRFQAATLPQTDGGAKAILLNNRQLVICDGRRAPRAVSMNHHWVLENVIGGIDSELISDRVTALDFRGDGEAIAIGSGVPSRSGQVMIVSASSGAVLRQFESVHSDSVLCVRFSPGGEILASAAADKTIRLLKIDTGEVVGSLDGHTHHVLSVAWKRDGRLIASGSADGTIKTWNVETGQQIRTIGGFPDEVTAVEFWNDSPQVVSSCADGQIRVHDTNNGGQVRAAGAAGDFLFATGISADGTRVFSAGQKGVVNVWETESLKSVGTW